MQIMYIDESGDTISRSQGGKKFLVLTGCVISENDKVTIESSFRDIKQKYYQNPEVELKSNFLRYANPDLKESSPIKLNDRDKYDELESEVSGFLKEIPAEDLCWEDLEREQDSQAMLSRGEVNLSSLRNMLNGN